MTFRKVTDRINKGRGKKEKEGMEKEKNGKQIKNVSRHILEYVY